MTEMDFQNRLNRVRTTMKERNIDIMYLTYGADLWYLAGIRRRQPELTDTNAYGNYICGAYFDTEDRFTLVAPRMGGEFFHDEASGKPWINDVRIINESESPNDVLIEILNTFKLKNKEISMDDRSWMQSGLLFQQILSDNSFSLASDIISPMRMIKDPSEIKLMKEAGKITDKVYETVIDFLKIGITEIDVAHEVDYQFAKRGAENSSFVTGVRFTKPNQPRQDGPFKSTSKKLESGDAITFDFGACYKGYCSDFGRSAFVNKPPIEYQKIHDIVMEAQTAAIEKMVDGQITALQLDSVARNIIENAGYGACFTHRLGHGIGVTVHEPPFLYQPDATVLVSNMTFTVEPSIRLPNSYACRVEDVVMVTNNGGVPFSNYHKELDII